MDVERSVTVMRPRAEVFAFWRQLENLPRFMIHLESVEHTTPGRTRWTAKSPGGSVEWDAEITEEVADERIAWRSLPGSEVANAGSVTFRDAPGDRGTEVHVALHYDVPGGKAGVMVAKLLGEEPSSQVRDDLRRFKQVMEVGEVVRSEGSPDGAGEGAGAERAAQASGSTGSGSAVWS
jgi:uncharacterized membrane protein